MLSYSILFMWFHVKLFKVWKLWVISMWLQPVPLGKSARLTGKLVPFYPPRRIISQLEGRPPWLPVGELVTGLRAVPVPQGLGRLCPRGGTLLFVWYLHGLQTLLNYEKYKKERGGWEGVAQGFGRLHPYGRREPWETPAPPQGLHQWDFVCL